MNFWIGTNYDRERTDRSEDNMIAQRAVPSDRHEKVFTITAA